MSRLVQLSAMFECLQVPSEEFDLRRAEFSGDRDTKEPIWGPTQARHCCTVMRPCRSLTRSLSVGISLLGIEGFDRFPAPVRKKGPQILPGLEPNLATLAAVLLP